MKRTRSFTSHSISDSSAAGSSRGQAHRFVVGSPPRRLAIAAAVALMLATESTPVLAQSETRVAESNGDGIDAHLFRAAVDSKGFFSVNGADILPHNNISFGLVLDYGYRIM